MKYIPPASIAAVLVATFPHSVQAGSFTVSGNDLLLAVLCVAMALIAVVILSRALSARRYTAAEQIVKTAIRNASESWRESGIRGKLTTGEIESAICSYKKFVEREGSDQIVDLLRMAENNPETASRMMLERAALVFPGAYRPLDARGKENHLTRQSRRFFHYAIRETLRESVISDSVEAQSTTYPDVSTLSAYEHLR